MRHLGPNGFDRNGFAIADSIGDKYLQITGSFGVSQRYDDTQTPDSLVDQADQALLCAKRTGRDRVIRYESLNDAGELEWATSEADLFKGHPSPARHDALWSCV